jgi:hypothetical protein
VGKALRHSKGDSLCHSLWSGEMQITNPTFIEKYAERCPGYENYHCNEDDCKNPVKHYLAVPVRGYEGFYCHHHCMILKLEGAQ